MELDFIKGIAEFLARYGIDPPIIAAVFFAVLVLKRIDRKNKFKAGYVMFPLMAALAICALRPGFEWRAWVLDSFKYAAIAAYLYDLYSKLAKRKPTP
jgi:hypothetical protein